MARIIGDSARNGNRPVKPHHTMAGCSMHDRSGDISISSSEPSEFSTCLSRSDALKLLEFIHRSISCNDEETFRALFPKLQELFPFDFATVVLGQLDEKNGIVTALDVNISFAEEWFRNIRRRTTYRRAPLSERTLRPTGSNTGARCGKNWGSRKRSSRSAWILT